jgi:signal transduction histidine kinase
VFNVTLDRLEDSFRTLDQFVTDASHELRTPLTTLRSVGEVGLRRSRTVEEYREIIASMLEEAQRMQLLVQRLLELASAGSGAQPGTRTRLRLDEWVTGCVSELGVLAEAKGQTLTFDLQPCEVLTDPIILRQALQNLVDNAIKYSPVGGTIAVTARESPQGCEVSVADDGPGISPEHRSRITERFFRTESARAEGVEGLGLGLSITKAYLKVLGGTLDYAPRDLRGSVFRITLPRA